MKLEHLLQSYDLKNVKVRKSEIVVEENRAGVLIFTNDITATYYIDNERIVTGIKIFANPKVDEEQIKHATTLLTIIHTTINLICNIPQKEINMIFDSLNIYTGDFKEAKKIRHSDYVYKIEYVNGLFIFSIMEIEQYPHLKSES